MRKKVKRSLIVLCIGMISTALLLSGCSGSGKTSGGGSAAESSGDDTKPITLSVFMDAPGQQPTADNKIYKLIKEKTGVSLNMEFLVGDLQQKLGVMIAGGDYPDLISGNDKLINAGAYIPLEDLPIALEFIHSDIIRKTSIDVPSKKTDRV
ncbi:hypothetical protein CPT76_19305 [Paenibacillus sp. AR247]|nr:hypothetical protein [Paenibacillus sp. AR247]PQP90054.1 hypothetical protein CPT76_19305 [Paenibacillus sp. AR247]